MLFILSLFFYLITSSVLTAETCQRLCTEEFWLSNIEPSPDEYRESCKLRTKTGNTPLHYAAAVGQERHLHQLIQSGINPNVRNEFGYTPLLSAISRCNSDNTLALIQRGASVHAKGRDGYSAMFVAVETCHDVVEFKKMIKVLVSAGIDVNTPRFKGYSILTKTAQKLSRHEHLSVLLEEGANLEAKDDHGDTALTTTVPLGYIKNIKILIDAGANPNGVDASGRTPLVVVTSFNSNLHEVIELLITAGANVNPLPYRPYYDYTPLHFVAESGSAKTVELLLNAGANGKRLTSAGVSAFELAKNNPKVVGSNAYWQLNDAQY